MVDQTPSTSERKSEVRTTSESLRRFVITLGLGVLLGVVPFLPGLCEKNRTEALCGACRGHMKRLALAMANYHQDFGTLPPAFVADSQGKPMHSWRVLILPYLEHGALYQEYDFSQPWNSPHNLALAEKYPIAAEEFHCPSDEGPRDCASYLAVVGPETLWPGATSPSRETLLGGAHRLLLVERKESGIHWMEPRDLSCDGESPELLESSPHEGKMNFILADGSLGSLKESGIAFWDGGNRLIRDWAKRSPHFSKWRGHGVPDGEDDFSQ